jgi:hypothetical protein
MSQNMIRPPIKSAGHSDLSIRAVKSEPFRCFGDVPGGEDDHGSEIPDVCEGDGAARAPEEVGAEVYEEDVEDTEGRGCGA